MVASFGSERNGLVDRLGGAGIDVSLPTCLRRPSDSQHSLGALSHSVVRNCDTS